jgi:O-antigen/teichoic acid export membrane protein
MDQETTLTDGVESAAHVSVMGRKAGRGLPWALSGTMLVKLGSFAMGLVLVRLIAPYDFGLYAVALAANALFIHVNDMGVVAATVQWRGRVEEMLPTGATLALGFSIAIAHAIVVVVVAIPLAVIALQRGGVNLRPVAPALVRPYVAACSPC